MEATVTQMERYRSTNLAAVIKQQGRFQRWLALQLGLSESMVSKVALGQRTLSRSHAERVAQLLGVPFFVLFELQSCNDSESREQSLVGDPA
jgi:transcriptional regulator with XRE-family HTH domain